MIIINNKYVTIFFLCILSIATGALAMRSMGAKHTITQKQRQQATKSVGRLQKADVPEFMNRPPVCSNDEIFIYTADTDGLASDGICWAKDTFQLSITLKEMLEDLGGWEKFTERKLPIPHSSAAIKNTYHVLKKYDSNKDEKERANKIESIIHSYSFQQLNDVANCLSFLDCPQDINKVIIDVMKKKLPAGSKNLDEVNFDLYPELKLSVMDPLINWVKNLCIAKNAQDKNKKKILAQASGWPNPGDFVYNVNYHLNRFKNIAIDPKSNNIAFVQNNNVITSDPEGKKLTTTNLPNVQISFPVHDETDEIVPSKDGKYAAYLKGRALPCILDISSGGTIEFSIVGNPANAIAHKLLFNYDSTKFATLSYHDLIIWNINAPTQPIMTIHDPAFYFFSMAFSPDGTKIAIGGSEQSQCCIKIFDGSSGAFRYTLQQPWEGSVSEIIFIPDGERIVASGYKTQSETKGSRTTYTSVSNLILWNIKDENPSFQDLDYQLDIDNQQAFAVSSDGKRMVTGGPEKTLELWDLSNYDNITHQTIAHLDGQCNSLALSNDGTMLVSGDAYSGMTGYKASLIRWNILTKEQKDMVEALKRYDTDKIRLLYQLYLKEDVTNPAIFNDLPKELQNVLPVLQKQQPSGSSWFGYSNK